jgi:hypothetical protein
MTIIGFIEVQIPDSHGSGKRVLSDEIVQAPVHFHCEKTFDSSGSRREKRF